MTGSVDRRQIDEEIKEHIRKSQVCMEQNREKIEEISEALFGEDGIMEWAREHIEAEKERAEIMKELKKKLVVKGTFGALGILGYLLWEGFSAWWRTGGPQ